MARLFFIFAIVCAAGPWTSAAVAEDALQGQLPDGYAKAERPDPPGTPTEVRVGLTIIDIINIDTAGQTFTADLLFELTWNDPRLKGPGGGPDRIFEMEDVWWPELGIMNRRQAETLLPRVVRVDSEGTVHLTQRLLAAFTASFDLREFPYDTQLLPVRIVSYRYGPDEVKLVRDDFIGAGGISFSAPGWRYDLSQADRTIAGVSITDRARLDFVIVAARNPRHIRLGVFLPLALIVLMAWSVFWIDPTYLPSQIGLSTASVFTLIAFRLSLKLYLPDVPYMSVADKVALGCTVLVFLALGEVIVAGWMVTNGKEAIARRMDRWARWVYLVVALALWTVTLGTRI